jgi:hypothetical protein
MPHLGTQTLSIVRAADGFRARQQFSDGSAREERIQASGKEAFQFGTSAEFGKLAANGTVLVIFDAAGVINLLEADPEARPNLAALEPLWGPSQAQLDEQRRALENREQARRIIEEGAKAAERRKEEAARKVELERVAARRAEWELDAAMRQWLPTYSRETKELERLAEQLKNLATSEDGLSPAALDACAAMAVEAERLLSARVSAACPSRQAAREIEALWKAQGQYAAACAAKDQQRMAAEARRIEKLTQLVFETLGRY